MVDALTTIAFQQRQRRAGDLRAPAIAAAAGTPLSPDGGASSKAWGGGDISTNTVYPPAGAGVYPTLSQTGDVKPSNPEATVKARGLAFASESRRARTKQGGVGVAGSIDDSGGGVGVSGCRGPRFPFGRDSATEARTQRACGGQEEAECFRTQFSSAAEEEDIGLFPMSPHPPPSRFGRGGLASSSPGQYVRDHRSCDEGCPKLHSLNVGEYDSDSGLSEGDSEVRGARGVSSARRAREREDGPCRHFSCVSPLSVLCPGHLPSSPTFLRRPGHRRRLDCRDVPLAYRVLLGP